MYLTMIRSELAHKSPKIRASNYTKDHNTGLSVTTAEISGHTLHPGPVICREELGYQYRLGTNHIS